MKLGKILVVALLLILSTGCMTSREGIVQRVMLQETPDPYTLFILRVDDQDLFFAMPSHVKDLRVGDRVYVVFSETAVSVVSVIEVLEDKDAQGYKRYRHIKIEYIPVQEIRIIKSAGQ